MNGPKLCKAAEGCPITDAHDADRKDWVASLEVHLMTFGLAATDHTLHLLWQYS